MTLEQWISGLQAKGTEHHVSGIDRSTSRNFEVAKVAAILMVFVGHFGIGFDFAWVVVTVGLFVFGFSSAFFTLSKYHNGFELGAFWKNKFYRLCPDLLVINGFLLALFLLRGKEGIWTWQTIVHVLGLTGFLSWFRLDNPSPFGGGLWVFTLLLIFYAVYPALRWMSRSRIAFSIFTATTFVVFAVLNCYVPMRHALWLAAWSFVFGVFAQRVDLRLSMAWGFGLATALAAVMLVLNVAFGLKILNYYFITAMSALVVVGLKTGELPRRPFAPLRLLSGLVLGIYFLHMKLFFYWTGYHVLDLLISLTCTIVVAWLLARAASLLRRLLAARMGAAQAGRLPS